MSNVTGKISVVQPMFALSVTEAGAVPCGCEQLLRSEAEGACCEDNGNLDGVFLVHVEQHGSWQGTSAQVFHMH